MQCKTWAFQKGDLSVTACFRTTVWNQYCWLLSYFSDPLRSFSFSFIDEPASIAVHDFYFLANFQFTSSLTFTFWKHSWLYVTLLAKRPKAKCSFTLDWNPLSRPDQHSVLLWFNPSLLGIVPFGVHLLNTYLPNLGKLLVSRLENGTFLSDCNAEYNAVLKIKVNVGKILICYPGWL